MVFGLPGGLSGRPEGSYIELQELIDLLGQGKGGYGAEIKLLEQASDQAHIRGYGAGIFPHTFAAPVSCDFDSIHRAAFLLFLYHVIFQQQFVVIFKLNLPASCEISVVDYVPP